MKEDHFVFDEEWEEQNRGLKQIIHEIDNPKLHKDVFVLQSFIRACAYSFARNVPRSRFLEGKRKPEFLGREISKPKYYRETLNIPVGSEVQPVPIPSTENIIQPVHTYQKKPVYVQKTIVKPAAESKIVQPQGKINLIVDKITNRVLASSELNDKYIMNEPKLDEVDIKVLNKVKKKKIRNMEKGWAVIQKYGKKYKINIGHDTLIKYYVVNDIFGLGQIEPFLHDDRIIAIYGKGPDMFLQVKIGERIYDTNVKLNKNDMESFIYSIAKRLGKKFDKKTTAIEGGFREFNFNLRSDKLSFVVKKNE